MTNPLAHLSDGGLEELIKDLQVLRWNALEIKDARSFGTLDRQLEAAWREQSHRSLSARA